MFLLQDIKNEIEIKVEIEVEIEIETDPDSYREKINRFFTSLQKNRSLNLKMKNELIP